MQPGERTVFHLPYSAGHQPIGWYYSHEGVGKCVGPFLTQREACKDAQRAERWLLMSTIGRWLSGTSHPKPRSTSHQA